MEYSKEFIKARDAYLKAYQDCFTEFTYGRCYDSSWEKFQDRFRETCEYMQSFTEEYEQLLKEQELEGKPKNPFFK